MKVTTRKYIVLLGVLVLLVGLVVYFFPHGVKSKTPREQRAARNELMKLLDPKDSSSVFKVVEAVEKDPVISRNCHEIGHDLGHKALKLYGLPGAMAFGKADSGENSVLQYFCAGGYMHGVLEQYVKHEPEFLDNPGIVCGIVGEKEIESCFHGVGHVFMIHHHSDVSKSIAGCRNIKQLTYRYRCFEGVRMEQFWGNLEYVSPASLDWDVENPLTTCVAVSDDEKPTCFLYVTYGYLRFHPDNLQELADLCGAHSLNDSDQYFCYKGLGMTLMRKFKGRDLDKTESYVSKLSLEDKGPYYLGFINYSRLAGVKDDELKTSCELLKNDSEICLGELSKPY